jgi:hypothetical protein
MCAKDDLEEGTDVGVEAQEVAAEVAEVNPPETTAFRKAGEDVIEEQREAAEEMREELGEVGLATTATGERTRSFAGALGALALSVRMEGGHYTFVEAHTDQIGESRLDKNVKKFFVQLHRRVDTRHAMEAGY